MEMDLFVYLDLEFGRRLKEESLQEERNLTLYSQRSICGTFIK